VLRAPKEISYRSAHVLTATKVQQRIHKCIYSKEERHERPIRPKFSIPFTVQTIGNRRAGRNVNNSASRINLIVAADFISLFIAARMSLISAIGVS